MKKLYFSLILSAACFFNGNAQTFQHIEEFTNAFANPNAVGYHDYTLNGITGSATMNCTICTSAINNTISNPITIVGNGVLLNRKEIVNGVLVKTPVLNMNFTNGVENIVFDVRRGNQVNGSIRVGIYNGTTLLADSGLLSSNESGIYTIGATVNLTGNVNLIIKEMTGSDTDIQNKNVVIDNVKWNDYTTASLKEDNISGLSIYPNPANNVVNITSKLTGSKDVVIYNVLGKQVLKVTTDQVINVSNLASGVYMVKITQEGKTATRKLVIK